MTDLIANRVGKCSSMALHQLCSPARTLAAGNIIDTILTADTILNDGTKFLPLEDDLAMRWRCKIQQAIQLPTSPSQINSCTQFKQRQEAICAVSQLDIDQNRPPQSPNCQSISWWNHQDDTAFVLDPSHFDMHHLVMGPSIALSLIQVADQSIHNLQSRNVPTRTSQIFDSETSIPNCRFQINGSANRSLRPLDL